MTDDTFACPTCGVATVAGDVFCEACGAGLPNTAAAVEEAHGALAATPAPEPSGEGGPACPGCGAGAASVVQGYCNECGLKQPAPRDHMESTGAGVAAVTDKGRRHQRNEDAFAFSVSATGAVRAVVCDGVSTSVNPDVASQCAADAALAVLDATDGAPADERHAKAFAAAREAVLGVTWTAHPGLGPPSCTYLAATVEGGEVELAGLGDCRAYWLPADGTPDMVTEDDSWATEQVKAGAMSEDDAYSAPQAHGITRWLAEDADPTWEPRRAGFTPPGPGRLLLCSDGLWNYTLRPHHVVEAAGTGDLLTVARRLVDHANAGGGSDNITVILVELPSLPPTSTDAPKGPTQ